MFDNVTLYYLNQIGITPWINKECGFKTRDIIPPEAPSGVKLVVITDSHVTTKAHLLLKRILNYLDVSEHELLVTTLDSQKSLIPGARSPLAVLALGLDGISLNELMLNCPVFNGTSPDYLLKNPFAKKKILKNLHDIKKLISK
jgi:DNA polymerase III psi subunit